MNDNTDFEANLPLTLNMAPTSSLFRHTNDSSLDHYVSYAYLNSLFDNLRK